jgi:DNA polymerase-1
VIDFNNMVYRARAGFSQGEHALVYTFFLMLRKTVEKFSPSKIYVVKEGRPQRRHDLFGEYKAGRSSPGDDFWRQHGEIVEILCKMPVHVVRHPLRECDDTIAHLVRVIHKEDPCVVISTDTDFIQLLSPDNDRIKLWNPTKDSWVPAVSYDYVRWKSLTGDGTDGIPGFTGVGGKTAEKLLSDPAKFEKFMNTEDGRIEKFERNLVLIAFHEIEDEIERSDYSPDWDRVRSTFIEHGFWSIANDKSWNKFTNTFSSVQ